MFDMKSTRSLATVMGRRERVATIVARKVTERDRRFCGRRPSEARAFIFAQSLTEPYPCTIRDQSATGARVTVALDPADQLETLETLPEKFTIVIQRDRVSIDCSVAWRHAHSMGLRFTSPARMLPKAPGSAPVPLRSQTIKPRR